MLREDFPELRTAVVIVSGDLFDQEDANLVVGFTDTFDTDTDRNIIISRESAQGLMLAGCTATTGTSSTRTCAARSPACPRYRWSPGRRRPAAS